MQSAAGPPLRSDCRAYTLLLELCGMKKARLLERCCTRKRALNRLLELMMERTGGKRVCVNLMQADVPGEARRLRGEVLSRFVFRESYATYVTAVSGAHSNRGSMRLSFHSVAGA